MSPLILSGGLFFTFTILGLVLPFGNLVWVAFTSHSAPISLDSSFWSIARFTYLQAFLSTLLAGSLGTFFAFLYSEFDFPFKKSLWRLSTLSFSLPGLLVALAFVGVWGKSGWFGWIWGVEGFYGWKAILLAHVFLNYSLFLRVVGQALIELDRTEEKIALSLGVNRLACFLKVTLPKIAPALRNAFGLSFLYCASSFVVVLLLGGGPRFSSVEVGIFQAVKVDLDLARAVLYALLQLGVCIALQGLVLQAEPNRPMNLLNQSRDFFPIYRFRSPIGNRSLLVFGACLYFIIILLPILHLLISGLPSLGSLDGGEFISALGISLKIAGQVALFSLLLGLAAAYIVKHTQWPWMRRAVSALCQLPIAISTMIFGLALILHYPTLYSGLRTGLWGVVFIQVMIALPLVFRVLNQGFSLIEQELYYSAQSLGATPFMQLTRLELPLLRKPIALALLLSTGLSLGEVGSVLLFESQGTVNLPLWLYHLMQTYRFQEAQAVGLVLMLVMGILYWTLGKWEQ